MAASSIAHTFVTGDDPLSSPLSLFILQTIIIISLSRLIGVGLKYIHQPSVIAEVIGGIILGKSALSRIDAFRETIFPKSSLSGLKLVADVGLVLFLFLVGLELDPAKMFRNAKKAASISLAGIIIPFACGIGASKALYEYLMTEEDRSLAPFASFLLFTGVAMSITAFPVLARILSERKLMQTTVGQLTISSAAVDDALAWILLLVVVAIINNTGNYLVALYVFLITLGWALFLFIAIRPLFKRLVMAGAYNDNITQFSVFLTFLMVLISAWFTEAVGVHAIFGGFLAGLIIPHEHGFAIKVTEKVEDLVSILFLPLYFAYSGLNTRIDQLNSGTAWGMVFLVIAVACVGKISGCFFTSRLAGLDRRESLAVGILMNTIELIVLNLGLQARVINVEVFTVMVIMALVTTFMTVPLISFVYPPKYYISAKPEPGIKTMRHLPLSDGKLGEEPIKVLLALPNMNSVRPMLSLVNMISTPPSLVELIALRLMPLGERLGALMKVQESSETLKADAVLNVFKTFAQISHLSLESIMTISPLDDYAENIASAAEECGANMIIVSYRMGDHVPDDPISKELTNMLDNRKSMVADLCQRTTCSLAVLIDRGFHVGETFEDQENVQMTVRSFNSMKVRSQVIPSVSIYLPFVGGCDDREALMFVLQFHKGAHVHLVVLEQEHQEDVKVSIPSEPLLVQHDSSKTLTENKDQHVLDHYSAAMNSSELLNTEKIKIKCDDTYSEMLEWIKSKPIHPSDLIVIGRELYEKGRQQNGTLQRSEPFSESLLEKETHCSVCIIQYQY